MAREWIYRGWTMRTYFWLMVGYCGSIEKESAGLYTYNGFEGEERLRQAMRLDIDKLEGVPAGIVGRFAGR